MNVWIKKVWISLKARSPKEDLQLFELSEQSVRMWTNGGPNGGPKLFCKDIGITGCLSHLQDMIKYSVNVFE